MSRQSLLASTGRVVRVLERIAADLDNLGLCRTIRRPTERQTRMILKHVTVVSWPSRREAKKLSHREQRTALRAELGLPPE